MGDRLRFSSAGAPTPAGKQSDGDPAATQVAMRLRDCLQKAWAPEDEQYRSCWSTS
ncbi:hypothetical protein [Exiguobacterium sp. s142]|uniref:hypothetical protein n=1 Tax=Exiguobacterium sp. s142 TaxID=2751222 RepID=UPI001BEC9F16|nr:hypothetical protein [Exiguobacterium sp. s142]